MSQLNTDSKFSFEAIHHLEGQRHLVNELVPWKIVVCNCNFPWDVVWYLQVAIRSVLRFEFVARLQVFVLKSLWD